MGYEIGSFLCKKNGPVHIECSSGLVQFWTTPEMTPVMSLNKVEARILRDALNWGLDHYYPE